VNETVRKLLFDECIGKPYIDALKIFGGNNRHPPFAEIFHLFDKFKPGEDDAVWIPQLANEEFILISADRAKRGRRKKSSNLPRLCAKYGLRHILLGGSLSQQKMFDKVLAVLSVWHEILAVGDSAAGTRYNLEHKTRGCATLVKKPAPENLVPMVPPGSLF
jgi:hypothetical protein